MRRIDNKLIPHDDQEVRLFMVGIDAQKLLPHVFKHHLGLGVDRIFYIDNNSRDGSIDVSLAYDNIHVWLQNTPFSGKGTPAKSGAAWIEELMRVHAVGNWCIVVDTDELFVYPDYQDKRIRDFVSELKGDCVRADFIDMYSNKKVKDTVIRDSLLETCPYTDREGNCRNRVLGFMPDVVKMPLFRFSPLITIRPGFHAIDGYNKLDETRCSVLHFKFTAELPDRLRRYGHRMTRGEKKMMIYKDIAEVNFYDKDVSVRFSGE